jgi:hypothetical protein
VSLVTYIKDIGWLLLIGLLLPLWMALALASLVFIVARHVYWWSRGNTTAVSRHGGRPRLAWAERRSSWRGGRRLSRPRDLTADRGPTAPVLVAPYETAPLPNR